MNNKTFNHIILALLSILYFPLIIHWFHGWLFKSISTEHEYFSHGIIGLPLAGYIIWENRHNWQKLSDQFDPLGIIALLIGAIFYLTQLSELINFSFPIILAGIFLILKGKKGFSLQKYPLLFILLATPNSIPYLIAPYTWLLQTFIAATAGFILIQFGFPVEVKDIYLFLGDKTVEVAPYCAGLKMLFTSLYVALLLLYWTGEIKSRPNTIMLLTGTILVSVVANIIRNTILTIFFGTGNHQAFVWLHDGWGGDLYSGLMLAAIGYLLYLIRQIEHYQIDSIEDL